ncbi:hypothetical protein ACFQ0T_16755 [Kitasatospora gansuensis]
MLHQFAVPLPAAGAASASQSTSSAAWSGLSAADMSPNQGREAAVSTSPGQAAATRMSRSAASSRLRASTRTEATWPTLDGTLIQSGQPLIFAWPSCTSPAYSSMLCSISSSVTFRSSKRSCSLEGRLRTDPKELATTTNRAPSFSSGTKALIMR